MPSNYSISVLDLSDPDAPLYAEHNGGRLRNPGSVGKLMVGLALFQTLADLYPDDIEARKRVLHDSMVTVDSFIHNEHHRVPFWLPKENRISRRTTAGRRHGQSVDLSRLDVLRQLQRRGDHGHQTADAAAPVRHRVPGRGLARRGVLSRHRTTELGELLVDALTAPVTRNGLDVERLRQGSFFSRNAKRRVPGTNSVSTTR